MKKTYKIEVDCANCANKMEAAASKAEKVKSVVVSFMTQKMTVEFDDDADIETVMRDILKRCKRVESDCEIHF